MVLYGRKRIKSLGIVLGVLVIAAVTAWSVASAGGDVQYTESDVLVGSNEVGPGYGMRIMEIYPIPEEKKTPTESDARLILL